jgi:hypothetical protein
MADDPNVQPQPDAPAVMPQAAPQRQPMMIMQPQQLPQGMLSDAELDAPQANGSTFRKDMHQRAVSTMYKKWQADDEADDPKTKHISNILNAIGGTVSAIMPRQGPLGLIHGAGDAMLEASKRMSQDKKQRADNYNNQLTSILKSDQYLEGFDPKHTAELKKLKLDQDKEIADAKQQGLDTNNAAKNEISNRRLTYWDKVHTNANLIKSREADTHKQLADSLGTARTELSAVNWKNAGTKAATGAAFVKHLQTADDSLTKMTQLHQQMEPWNAALKQNANDETAHYHLGRLKQAADILKGKIGDNLMNAHAKAAEMADEIKVDKNGQVHYVRQGTDENGQPNGQRHEVSFPTFEQLTAGIEDPDEPDRLDPEQIIQEHQQEMQQMQPQQAPQPVQPVSYQQPPQQAPPTQGMSAGPRGSLNVHPQRVAMRPPNVQQGGLVGPPPPIQGGQAPPPPVPGTMPAGQPRVPPQNPGNPPVPRQNPAVAPGAAKTAPIDPNIVNRAQARKSQLQAAHVPREQALKILRDEGLIR